jgi:hypothetical protein
MANKDKATNEQPGLDRRREITNTGGRLDDDPSAERPERERTAGEHPTSVGKSGDDAWHGRSNRRSEKSEDAEPMRGGNQPRPTGE